MFLRLDKGWWWVFLLLFFFLEFRWFLFWVCFMMGLVVFWNVELSKVVVWVVIVVFLVVIVCLVCLVFVFILFRILMSDRCLLFFFFIGDCFNWVILNENGIDFWNLFEEFGEEYNFLGVIGFLLII